MSSPRGTMRELEAVEFDIERLSEKLETGRENNRVRTRDGWVMKRKMTTGQRDRKAIQLGQLVNRWAHWDEKKQHRLKKRHL